MRAILLIGRLCCGKSTYARQLIAEENAVLLGSADALLHTYGLESDTLYHLSRATAVSDLAAVLETEFFAQRPFWPELAQAKLHELFILVARGLADAPAPAAVRVETADACGRSATACSPNPGTPGALRRWRRMPTSANPGCTRCTSRSSAYRPSMI